MKKLIAPICFLMLACGSKKESPTEVANRYCELEKKMTKATSEPERDKIKTEMDNFEKNVNEEYGKDEEFMKKLDEEISECEDSSNNVDYDGD